MKRSGQGEELSAWRRWTARWRALPDWVVIGAMKGGTSALYHYLEHHPGVAASRRKELHFFDEQFGRGLDHYRAQFPLRWVAGGRLTGEATPAYFCEREAPVRMREAVPGVKLLAVLRDPVGRAYSHYQHNRRKGREGRSFGEAVEAGLREADGSDQAAGAEGQVFAYVERGRYVATLRRWWEVFPREQILVLSSEEWAGGSREVYGRLCGFLGLEV